MNRILGFLLILSVGSLVHAEGSGAPSQKDSSEWRAKMVELYTILGEMTTDTVSAERFNAPKNRSRIEKNAQRLANRAHELSTKGLSPDLDPTIQIVSELFQSETQRAYLALKAGNREYARGILTQVSGYCIACHTRNDAGPSFSSLPFEPVVETGAKNLDALEKARFYAATRQYDRALALFQKIVADSNAPIERPLEWQQAVRYGLAISIRVKKDPKQALALIDHVIGSTGAPFFMKQDALKWKESVGRWQEELPKRTLTEEGLHGEAGQLMVQARELQKFPMDHAADVLYLRATSVIHELLQKFPNGRYAQEALMMAGLCYEVLRPLSIDEVHEVYFEACIKKTPHTQNAELCFRRYEQSTYEGYTGSAGTLLPEDVKKKLHALEVLSHPDALPDSKMN